MPISYDALSTQSRLLLCEKQAAGLSLRHTSVVPLYLPVDHTYCVSAGRRFYYLAVNQKFIGA